VSSAASPPRGWFASPRVLFWTPTLIWGTTWHVILYQLAEAPAVVAVAWRFGLASMLLFALAAMRGEALLPPRRWHAGLALTGVLQFALNYGCVYEAERHIPTGLVAVLFALMIFGNALGGWWALGQRVTRGFLAAGAIGVAGVTLIFWPEIARAVDARTGILTGLALGLLAVAAACAGNTLTLMLSQRGLGLVPMLAWCMAYGALALAVFALATGQSLAPGHSLVWWASLLYLAALGSVAAFLLYFRLSQRVGSAFAALTGVLTPPIALAVSAALEGWRPTALSLAGIALTLLGVGLAVRTRR
jgi:drug/metabolite transporter (DMT)-like permease